MSEDDRIQRPVVGREIATTGDGRDITRGYTGQLLLPSDRVLRGRGAGDLTIYEQVLSEAQVAACFRQRRSAVTAREWQVDAASDRRIDRRAADHLRAQLKRIGWDRVTDLMLFGLFYGYAVAEIVYGREEGLLTWDRIRVRNRRRFRFGEHGDLRLLTPANPYPGVDAPKPYFWHFCTGSDHDDEPYGLGLAHWLYWPVLIKRNGLKFWLVFLEKFGMPTSVGKYDVSATDAERSKLLAATQAIQTDAGIIIPEGMELSLLEAARSGTADYKTLHDTMDATIAKVVLGQSASTEGTPGRLGNDDLQSDVRADIVKADADLVCESLNCGPVRWLTMMNFPDADPPRVYRVTDIPDDLDTLANRDTKVFALGFRPGLEYIHETYGDHWEPTTDADPVDSTDGAGPPNAPVAFADGRDMPARAIKVKEADQNLIAQQAAVLAESWSEFVGPRVDALLTLLDETRDLDLFRERLAELAEAEPNAPLVEALTRAGFGAHLAGRNSQA